MRHKQSSQLVSAIALAAGWLSASSGASAQDGLADVRAIKPVLMLVVDTSGSMERMPTTNALPSCTGNTLNDATQKNRWTGALEAMTGSFSGYACAQQNRAATPYTSTDYDYGYYLPHIAPLPTVSQTSDGVLDALQYSVKFGLMTFDGQGTYQDGDPLIPFSSITGSSSLSSLIGNAPTTGTAGGTYAGEAAGMYSYGLLKKLSFPGCVTEYGMNLGVRGPGTHPGALISVGSSDDPISVQANNDRVQSSLLAVRPYGGTPVAAALDDLKYWLQHSADVLGPAQGGNDLFGNCRDKYALLLTDGAPDTMYRDTRYVCEPPSGGVNPTAGVDRDGDGTVAGEEEVCAGGACSCPYETEVDIATDLVSSSVGLDKLFVVAFAVDDPTAITSLDQIALAGKTTSAQQVETAAELRQALGDIFSQLAPKATSRTVPVTVDGNTGEYTNTSTSFEIRAGFRPNAQPEDPWDGILERTPISCAGSSVNYAATLSSQDEFHTQLNIQSAANQRSINTIDATPASMRGSLRTAYSESLDSTAYSGQTVPTKGPDSNALPTGTIAPDITYAANQATFLGGRSVVPFSSSLDPVMFGNADKDGTPYEVEDVQYIKNFLDGSSRPGHALSDIYHSNPVAMGPLVTQGVGSRIGSWRNLVKGTYTTNGGTRPQVVFAATNDGLLHAFNLDTWNGVAPGREFWSFTPPALFDKLHTAAAPNHIFMFDGDMVLKDLYLGPRDDANVLLATRTILLAAVRGAPAYVALDVTNPDQAPKLLWQYTAPDMGDTLAKPQLVQVLIEWTTGEVQERAMAILPGGRGELIDNTVKSRGTATARAPSDRRTQGRNWRNRGRALYLVDVATGQLVMKFDQRHFPAPITGSIGIDTNRPLGQSAYFTDEDGVLWHLALDGKDPAKWHVEPIWDVFHGTGAGSGPLDGRPSSYAPIVTRDKTGSNVILLATGDIDSLTDATRHRVVSLREQRTVSSDFVATSVKSVTGVADRENWEIKLASGESVTGPLTLLDGVVYFASFVGASGSGDACALGSSYLWGVDFIELDSANAPLPMGKMVVNDGPPPQIGRSRLVENNSVVLGLSAGQDPLCLTGNPYTNPVTGDEGFVAKGGPAASTFSLRANMGSATSGGTSTGNSDLQLFSRSFTMTLKSKVVGWAGSVE